MGIRLTDKDCPICDEGKLMDMIEGHGLYLETCYSLCDTCGSEIANAEQSRKNKESHLKAKAKEKENETI